MSTRTRKTTSALRLWPAVLALIASGPAFTLNRQLLGASLKGSVGADDLWDGATRRSYYGGIGMSFDVHFGKRIPFIEIERLFQKNREIHWAPTLCSTAGIRGSSVELAP